MIIAELVRDIEQPWQGLFLGIHERKPVAVTVGFLPQNAFYLAPTVGFAYSDHAPRHVVAAVGARLRAWFVEQGYHEAWVINLMHTDRAFMVGLRHFGAAERIGSVVRFGF
jgi:hypothetical protein